MKVKELIDRLNEFDSELMVVQGGYEGGLTENFNIKEIGIKLNVHEEWYYGEHEEDETSEIKAVVL